MRLERGDHFTSGLLLGGQLVPVLLRNPVVVASAGDNRPCAVLGDGFPSDGANRFELLVREIHCLEDLSFDVFHNVDLV